MGIKTSIGLERTLLEGSDMRTALNGVVIDVYQGTMPTSPEDPCTGTKLLTFSLNDTGAGCSFGPLPASPSVTLSKTSSEVWSGTVTASGTAQYFRLRKVADNANAQSNTAIRIDGTVGSASGDMILGGSTSMVLNELRIAGTFVISLSGEGE